MHVCNPSTEEVQAGEPDNQGLPGLHKEFKTSLCYVNICLKYVKLWFFFFLKKQIKT